MNNAFSLRDQPSNYSLPLAVLSDLWTLVRDRVGDSEAALARLRRHADLDRLWR